MKWTNKTLVSQILGWFICFMLPESAAAQGTFSWVGQCVHAETGEALPYVSVYLNQKPYTTTNSSGYFHAAIDPLEVDATGKIASLSFMISGMNASYELPKHSWKTNDTVLVLIKPISQLLGDMVITASRQLQRLDQVTVSMEILKPSLLEKTNAVKLDDGLDQVSGLNMVNGQLNIRGGSGFSYGVGSRVALLVDDLPMLSGDASDIKFDMIPTEQIGQVEIIKGASSALFGSGALGGIVNVRTLRPGAEPTIQLKTWGGIFDRPKNGALAWWEGQQTQRGISAVHSQRVGRTDVTAGAFYFYDAGYRKGETNENSRLTLNLKHHFKKAPGLTVGISALAYHTVGGNFLFWNKPEEALLPRPGTLSQFNNTRFALDPSLHYTKSGGTTHKMLGRLFETSNHNSANGGSLSNVMYGEYQYQTPIHWSLGKTTVTGGLVAIFTTTKSGALYGNHRGQNQAVYAQLDHTLKKQVISLGIRYETNQMDRLKRVYFPVIRTGYSIEAWRGGHFRASWGNGYRFPSVAERFTLTSSGGIFIFPNPNVLPEKGFSAELGLRQAYRIKKCTAYTDLAAFWTQYYQMIEYLFDFQNFGFKAQNQAFISRIRGLEFSGGCQLEINKLKGTISGGYTWIDPRYLIHGNMPVWQSKVDGQALPLLKYRIRNTVKLNADASWRGFFGGFTLRYNSFMDTVDGVLAFITISEAYRKAHHTGYTLLDLRIGYSLKDVHTFSLVIKNALNTEYLFMVGNMGAPRMALLQYSWQWKGKPKSVNIDHVVPIR